MPTRPIRTPGPFAWLALLLALLCVASTTRAQPVLVQTGHRPDAIYAADVNGDGILDLILINASTTPAASTMPAASTTRVLLGDGRGGFTQSATLATAGKSLIISNTLPGGFYSIFWILVTDRIASLVGAAGKGDGTFYPAGVLVSFPLSGSLQPAPLLAVTAVRPFYGRAAILVEDTANAMLYEAAPNPDSSYAISPVSSYAGIPVLPGVTGLFAADVNGDHAPDTILQAPAGVQVVLGTQTGLTSTSSTHAAANGVESSLLADMDSDGVLDLITADATGRIDIFHGNGDGTFAATSEIGSGAATTTTGNGGHLIGIADLNGDGIPDILTATPLGISVLLGQAGLSFKLAGIYDPGAGNPNAGRTSFVLADFNGDGHLDLAVDSPQGVEILFGNADGSFAAPRAITGTLAASPEPSLYGSDFTLTATLTPTASGAAPTGTVTFAVDGTTVGSAAVLNNVATYTISAPAYIRGTHTLMATYSGDANYSPQTVTGTHAISGLRSATTITVTTPTIFYGQVADGIGRVAALDSAGTATALDSAGTATVNGGNINFYENGNLICTLPINGTPGTCPLTAGAGLAAGLHVLTAAYSGNNFYDPSTSDPGNVQVLPDVTTAALASSTNPSIVGQPVTFTATIAAPYATPTGSVTFSEGSTVLGTGTLNAKGIATFTTSSLTIGTHSMTASYAATTNFNASASAVLSQVVTVPPLPATTTLLSSSVNPSYVGQPVIFSATVISGTTPAAGAVNFMIDGVLSNPIALNAQGQAALTAATLTQGSHTVIALFGATSTLAASTSASLIQQVNPQGAGGFTLTVNPTTLAVPIGSSVSVLVTITPLNGFAQPVNLTCTGMPDESACTFANATIPAGGGVTRLTVTAAAPHDCGTSTPYFVASGPTTLFDALATAALMFLLRRRRAVFKGLTLVLLFTFLPALSGCAGNCTDLGVRPGTYSFTVTATSTGSPAITVTQVASFAAHL